MSLRRSGGCEAAAVPGRVEINRHRHAIEQASREGAVESRFLRRKKHAGRAGHIAKPVKRGFRPGRPAERLFDLNRGEPGPERRPRKVKGMRCGPAGTCRPDGGEVEGMTRAARQVLDQDRYLARLVEKQN